MKPLLDYDKLSSLTGIPVASLRYMRACGTGPDFFRLGRRVVCTEESYVRWLEEQAAADAARRGSPAPAA